MQKFLKNTKGAVTIFVSLLLIPAMLVSGTAVDLARIHTGRSIIQDANQLAANTVLTQYDAMLQDIYGLFGVMESDPVLGGMLNEYIEVSIFGKEEDQGLGTFQLFYGANSPSTVVTPVTNQNLSNPDILRRQIEEYAKFRVPVIIVDEILDRIEQFQKVKEDADAIEKKMDIDDKIDEIDKIYEEIYNLIQEINAYPSNEKSAFDSINSFLGDINGQFRELNQARDDWTSAFDHDEEDLAGDIEKKYSGIKKNINVLVNGGNVTTNWTSGAYNALGIWKSGKWGNANRRTGLNQAIGDRKSDLKRYVSLLDQLVSRCEKADKKKEELSGLIDELDQKLSSGKCSPKFVEGMNTRDHSGKSTMEWYRDLIKHSLKPMAEIMKSRDEAYINGVVSILDSVGYGNIINNTGSAPFVSRINLGQSLSSAFNSNNIVAKRTIPSTDIATLSNLAALVNYRYSEPSGFILFQGVSSESKEFCELLESMFGQGAEEAKNQKKTAENKISKLLKNVQEKYKEIANIATLTPGGAKYYRAEADDSNSEYGKEGDWGNKREAGKKTKNALNNNIISRMGDFFNDAGNKILLLTYDTEMFSNFTTVEGTKTMSGIPMSTDVNYFFQSELEYLYKGNAESARSNIAAVSSLIFLVRFVFNYISTFMIDDVRYELWLISSASGPFTVLVRELARLGYALGESVLDMTQLMARPGKSVPLLKKNGDWTFSLHRAGIEGAESIAESFTDIVLKEREDTGTGMYYIDYLRIFLLFVDGDTLAARTSQLMSWNITNKKNGIKANEKTMGGTSLFDMGKAYTDFSVSTTVDMRMLFLSMPFAQKGINGVIPPKSMPIMVTDYRGY